jgi:hypothetical protein
LLSNHILVASFSSQVVAYTIVNAMATMVYIAALFFAYYSKDRSASVEVENLIEDTEDPEDKEKYTACKLLFIYQLCIVAMVSELNFTVSLISYTIL